jgi:hypothetical protein
MFTKRQIAALKYLILKAPVESQIAKLVLTMLIDESEMLTREVCLTLVEGDSGYNADEISYAAHAESAFTSSNCPTHLNEIMKAMGSDLFFCCHYGDFDPLREGNPFSTEGQFAGCSRQQVSDPKLLTEGMPMRYTFWLAREYYSKQAVLVGATRETLEKVDLAKSDPYAKEFCRQPIGG